MKQIILALVFLGLADSACWGQKPAVLGEDPWPFSQPNAGTPWRGLALSMAAQGAASGFDAWSSWHAPERNGLLADGGRFTGVSAARKAGLLAGVSAIEVLVVKKWGKKYPWIARACQIGNFTSAGMMFGAGVRNMGMR